MPFNPETRAARTPIIQVCLWVASPVGHLLLPHHLLLFWSSFPGLDLPEVALTVTPLPGMVPPASSVPPHPCMSRTWGKPLDSGHTFLKQDLAPLMTPQPLQSDVDWPPSTHPWAAGAYLGQLLSIGKVVHGDGQEDVQQGVWWLQLRKDVYAPASPGAGHGSLHATQGPISPGPGQPCLLPWCPLIPQPCSHVSPHQTQPSPDARWRPPSLLDANLWVGDPVAQAPLSGKEVLTPWDSGGTAPQGSASWTNLCRAAAGPWDSTLRSAAASWHWPQLWVTQKPCHAQKAGWRSCPLESSRRETLQSGRMGAPAAEPPQLGLPWACRTPTRLQTQAWGASATQDLALCFPADSFLPGRGCFKSLVPRPNY